jgi:AP endonuclease 2
LDGTEKAILDIMNPSDVFSHGERQRELSFKDVPSFSAKYFPEFDKRRSIKDMLFKRTPTVDKSTVGRATSPSKEAAPMASNTGASKTTQSLSTAKKRSINSKGQSPSKRSKPSQASVMAFFNKNSTAKVAESNLQKPVKSRELSTTDSLIGSFEQVSQETTATENEDELPSFLSSSTPALAADAPAETPASSTQLTPSSSGYKSGADIAANPPDSPEDSPSKVNFSGSSALKGNYY